MAALSGELAGLLGARRGEWWVVRPDGHLAAVVTELAQLYPALCRAVGHTAPATPTVHAAPRHLHHARESGISAGRVADIGSVGRPLY
jgi:hypothetical protein